MKTIIALLALVASLAGPLAAQDRISGRMGATRSEVLAQRGMACTSQPLATQAALQILQRGGSAVDAAIAANAVLALTEPVGCGLGGDLFALVWDAKAQKLHGLNASGRAPQALTLALLKEKGLAEIPALGPLPVTVPGCVDGWFELHQRWGRLTMAQNLAPAIYYARQGFPVSQLIAYYWGRSVPALSRFPGFTEQFTLNGKAPAEGEIFRNPNLARTLETLARDGRDAFYRGPMARTMASYIQRQGGVLSYEDLAAHRSEWVEPVSTTYRGYQVWQLPPNGQGLAVLQLLNLLEGYDLRAMGYGSADYLHTFVEAKKLVFADRARHYADPAFYQVPVSELVSKEYAARRRSLINPQRAARSAEPGTLKLKEGDTIYLTVADSAGNIVSLIQSNYRGMGSGMCPDGLGFILQDRGELFATDPTHPNVLAPGKRPFHTIIPGFVTKDGQPWLSFGVMGGEFQPLGQVQILVNMIDFGMNLQEAADAPRFSHSGSTEPVGPVTPMTDGGEVQLEHGWPEESLRTLLQRGHRLTLSPGAYGGFQGIMWDAQRRVYHGASESRKDGQAAGY